MINRLSATGAAVVLAASALIPAQAQLMDLDGTLGKQPIGMSLQKASMRRMAPGAVHGLYFYTKYGKDIPLEGELDAKNNLTLYELGPDKKPAAVIKGVFDQNIASIIGTWSKLDGTSSLPISLQSSQETGGTLEKRYWVAGVEMPNDVYEAKVQDFVKALVAGDKQAVARMVNYPLNVNAEKSKRKIRNKAQLITSFESIFPKSFIARAKSCSTHNMFSRDQGVMLGNGLLWFGADGKAITVNQ